MNEDPQTPIAPVGFAVIRSYIAVLETAERTERENPHYSWFEMGAILRALHNLAERDEHQDRELHHLRRSIHNLTVQFHAFVAGEATEADVLQNLQAQIDALTIEITLGSPTYTWVQQAGDGTLSALDQPALTVTPGTVDDIIGVTVENVAADAGGGVQSFTSSIDLGDVTAPTVQFPSGINIIATA